MEETIKIKDLTSEDIREISCMIIKEINSGRLCISCLNGKSEAGFGYCYKHSISGMPYCVKNVTVSNITRNNIKK